MVWKYDGKCIEENLFSYKLMKELKQASCRLVISKILDYDDPLLVKNALINYVETNYSPAEIIEMLAPSAERIEK